MAIRRNIAGFDYLEYEEINNKVGLLKPADVTIQYYSVWPKEPSKKNPYFGNDPFLGLSSYGFDYLFGFSVKPSIGWQALTDQINAKIQQGPHPGHTVTADEVMKVYYGSMRHYNFYYPGGVPIGFTPINWPANLTRPILTDDDRLTLSNDKEFPINEDIETIALVAWLQSYIYEFDETPYLITPTELHYFSKDIKGKPGKGDLFKRHKKKTFIRKVGEGIVKGLKFVKNTVFKIVGAIPRNAFLGMVGLNVFNFAKNMQQKIDAGKWPEMAAKWKSLGGNPDKLKNTIEDGADKPEQDKDFDANKIGEPATATAIIAAAAPIIAAMLAFIKDDSGKINDVLAATKNFMATKFPDVDFGPLGFLDKKTGKQIEFIVDPEDDENINPNQPTGMTYHSISGKRTLIAAGAGIGAYFLTKRKNILVAAAVAAAVYFINPTND